MRILITGGSGFLGRHVLSALSDSSHELLVLSRRRDLPLPKNASLINRGLDKVEEMTDAFRSCDVLIHMASELRNESLMEKVNHEYTKDLISTASKAGILNFVHLSSVGVTGFGQHYTRAVCTETTACHPSNVYEQTKYKGELAVLNHADTGMRKVVLRPTNVFGDDHPRHALLPLFRRVVAKQWIPYTKGSKVNYVYVGDVVNAIRIAAESPTLSGVYQVGEPTETGEFLEGVARTLGVGSRAVKVPASLITSLATMMPSGASSRLKSLCNFAEYSSDQWLANTPMKYEMWKGIQRTIAWYKKEGLL